jgi:hypothetical protein
MSQNIQSEYVGKTILTRDASMEGKVISATRRCSMEGCLGIRLGVRWPNGRLTYPCSRGITNSPDGKLQIA